MITGLVCEPCLALVKFRVVLTRYASSASTTKRSTSTWMVLKKIGKERQGNSNLSWRIDFKSSMSNAVHGSLDLSIYVNLLVKGSGLFSKMSSISFMMSSVNFGTTSKDFTLL